MLFQALHEHLWIFEFTDDADKRRVLEGRPWLFDRYILVLNDFDDSIALASMDFRFSPFWVQVHELPLICMSEVLGQKIGSSLGEFIAADVAGDGGGWGRCLRIRVNLDLTKPLERGRTLLVAGKTYWVSFKYEKLPLICFSWGRIVHGSSGCPLRSRSRGKVNGGEA